jgi:hypothetical protein
MAFNSLGCDFLEFLLDNSLIALLTRCSRVFSCDYILESPFSGPTISDGLLVILLGLKLEILAEDFQLICGMPSTLGISPRYFDEKVAGE